MFAAEVVVVIAAEPEPAAMPLKALAVCDAVEPSVIPVTGGGNTTLESVPAAEADSIEPLEVELKAEVVMVPIVCVVVAPAVVLPPAAEEVMPEAASRAAASDDRVCL
jgi:hypothetical protein